MRPAPTHTWFWRSPEGRQGMACRILVCHRRKAIVEFVDGYKMVAPAQGLRKLKAPGE